MQTLYSLQAAYDLIDKYMSFEDAECITLEEGVLGLGLTVLMAEGKKFVVIKEVPLNANSSAHSIRLYNKCPKKYQDMIQKHNEEEYLLEAIQEYEEREFKVVNTNYLTDIIDLAYTETESGKHSIEVYFNMKKMQYEETIDNKIVLVHKLKTIDELVHDLRTCSFDDMVADVLAMAEKMEEKEND